MAQASAQAALTKVPEVTLGFWIIKIAATTLGETGGDSVSMSLGFGYLLATAIFAVVFVTAVSVQVSVRCFNPWLYWLTIVATTTVGTTLADFADRSLGIGYPGGAAILLVPLLASLAAWKATLGTIAVESVAKPRAETFYWLTIMCSQTLGTALGDWTADSAGLGYAGSTLVFGGLLALVAGVYFFTRVSRTVLFWITFMSTRPLGAVIGDFLDKPHADGGMAMSRFTASAVLLAFMATCIALLPQRAAERAH